MNKRDEISDELYSKMRSTGGQPARLYGLAKVHKDETPLRTVLSLPGSSYENLNKMLPKCFDNIDEANIETNTKEARETIENIALDPDETIISPDVKRLYTNVLLKEAIEIRLILANLWLKEYEFAQRQEISVGTEVQQINDKNGLCPCCSRKVRYRSKGVECECCQN